jgi:hypothetical protein
MVIMSIAIDIIDTDEIHLRGGGKDAEEET